MIQTIKIKKKNKNSMSSMQLYYIIICNKRTYNNCNYYNEY